MTYDQRRPSDLHHYHASLIDKVEDADWLDLEDDDSDVTDILSRECGIYATED